MDRTLYISTDDDDDDVEHDEGNNDDDDVHGAIDATDPWNRRGIIMDDVNVVVIIRIIIWNDLLSRSIG